MPSKPSALLLIATGCQHCPSVMKSLTELLKEGQLSRLEIVNIAEDPERAQQLNVRSVPWVKLGEYELLGLKSKTVLLQWIEKSQDPENLAEYFEELMTSGELSKVQQWIEDRPESIQGLFDIMTNEKSSLSARIGVGAIMEEFAGSKLLKSQISTLSTLCQHASAQVRNDACYYLSLTQSPQAAAQIQPLLNDENAEVRETAEDALAELEEQ